MKNVLLSTDVQLLGKHHTEIAARLLLHYKIYSETKVASKTMQKATAEMYQFFFFRFRFFRFMNKEWEIWSVY